MEIPQKELSQQEIQEYWKMAQAVISDYGKIRSSTSCEEIQVYREMLSSVTQGIETILDAMLAKDRDTKNKIGSIKLLLKDLARHETMAKDKYWSLKRP